MDSVDAEIFRTMTRGGDVHMVLRVIDEALAAGLKVKINAVPVRGMKRRWLDAGGGVGADAAHLRALH